VGCEHFDDKFKIHNHKKHTILLYMSEDSQINNLINYNVNYNAFIKLRSARYFIKANEIRTMISAASTWEGEFINEFDKPMPWYIFVIDSSKQTMDTTILLKNNLVTTYRLDVDYLQKRNWVLDIW
jgi:hypothetical protein